MLGIFQRFYEMLGILFNFMRCFKKLRDEMRFVSVPLLSGLIVDCDICEWIFTFLYM